MPGYNLSWQPGCKKDGCRMTDRSGSPAFLLIMPLTMFRIAAVTASLAAFASVASASPIVVVQELGAGQPRAAKLAAKAAVLAGLGPYAILEDFEDIASS